jgi:hypothetical protein
MLFNGQPDDSLKDTILIVCLACGLLAAVGCSWSEETLDPFKDLMPLSITTGLTLVSVWHGVRYYFWLI